MAYTQYGQIAHRIRERNNEVRFNMADRLGITYEELSDIETGMKKVTLELIQKLVEEYKIDPEEEQEIRKAAIASNVYFEMIKNHVIQEIVKKYNIGPEEEQKIREAANASNDWLKMMDELVKQKKALAQSEG